MADATPRHLPDTVPLEIEDDLAARMVSGIDAYLQRYLQEVAEKRGTQWHRDYSTPESYIASIEPNRLRFSKLICIGDHRVPVVMQNTASLSPNADLDTVYIAQGNGFKVYAVKWSVLEGIGGEGLLLQPDGPSRADIIAVPDCDWTPEMLVGLTPGVPAEAQFARRLAESGCRVVVPALIDRQDTFSGIPEVAMTNQPHREFVYRAAYEVGRYPIGYEVQKILAVVDWFVQGTSQSPIGIIGYGEGGLLAMYAAAVDKRIAATAVSGYFEPREQLFNEPIYRNVFGLLTEFGDAEIASLIAPRTLIVETCRHPEVDGPPEPAGGRRGGAAPGRISTPSPDRVRAEIARARQLTGNLSDFLHLISNDDGKGLPGANDTLATLMKSLTGSQEFINQSISSSIHSDELSIDSQERQQRQFLQMLDHTQHLMRESEYRRAEFWSKADRSSVDAWETSCEWYRAYFHDELIGRLPESHMPLNPRTRLIYETESFTGYEVVLDVFEDVIAYGIILVPKDIKEGESRPVVVCQHGLEGRPQDVADPDLDHEAYHRYACALAERGYVTYAPQNPYIGQNTFRELLRKAHPVKQSMYGFIVRQHERTVEWLASLPYVDAGRIAFYGLSYGGKTAMRIPPLVQGYCLSICSADYNEWVWKNMSDRAVYSYLLTGEYDMPEYNLANTFNYAEMSWLICPRPFMVERGHEDGVAPDEWVAYEFAKTYRHYVKLGIGDRTEIEVFDGPHAINGKGTFAFLDRFLLSN